MLMIRSADEVRDRDACIHVRCVRDGVSLTTQNGVRVLRVQMVSKQHKKIQRYVKHFKFECVGWERYFTVHAGLLLSFTNE